MTTQTVNIMLVEDDDVDAESVARGLKRNHIANPLYRARDGIEALDMLRGTGGHKKVQSPYLLLVDLNMPRMDGIGLLKALRDDRQLQKAIVFVLTTSKSEEDKCAAYQQNVAGYLLKSNVGNDFVRVVDMLGHFWKIVEFPQG